jgi:hypothetical protein
MALNPQNLIPLNQRTEEEKKKIVSAGGTASARARRKRKLMSQIYGEMLADRYEVSIKGEKKKISGEKFFKAVAKEILTRKDASSVAMLKEIREATEGNKLALDADVNMTNMTPEQKEDRLKNLIKELDE